jgi:hypothetical protein
MNWSHSHRIDFKWKFSPSNTSDTPDDAIIMHSYAVLVVQLAQSHVRSWKNPHNSENENSAQPPVHLLKHFFSIPPMTMKRSNLLATEKKQQSLSDFKNDTFNKTMSAPAAPISSQSSMLWDDLRRELMGSGSFSISTFRQQRSMSMTESPSRTMNGRKSSWEEKRRKTVSTIVITMPTNLESVDDCNELDDEHISEAGNNSDDDDGESEDDCTTDRCVLPNRLQTRPM